MEAIIFGTSRCETLLPAAGPAYCIDADLWRGIAVSFPHVVWPGLSAGWLDQSDAHAVGFADARSVLTRFDTFLAARSPPDADR